MVPPEDHPQCYHCGLLGVGGTRTKATRNRKGYTVQSLHNAMFRVHRNDRVISEPWYKGTVLQRNYRKMTMKSDIWLGRILSLIVHEIYC